MNKQAKPYVNIWTQNKKKRTSMDIGWRYGTFDKTTSDQIPDPLAKPTNPVEKVEMSITNLRNLRGSHDRWSLKDVPIKLLRKPLNYGMAHKLDSRANCIVSSLMI